MHSAKARFGTPGSVSPSLDLEAAELLPAPLYRQSSQAPGHFRITWPAAFEDSPAESTRPLVFVVVAPQNDHHVGMSLGKAPRTRGAENQPVAPVLEWEKNLHRFRVTPAIQPLQRLGRVLIVLSLIAASAAAPSGFARSVETGRSSFVLKLNMPVFFEPEGAVAAGEISTWELDVQERGRLLWIAIDTPSRVAEYRLDLVAPDGSKRRFFKRYAYSAETRVRRPAAGRWRLKVKSVGGSSSRFRLRAFLSADDMRVPLAGRPDLRLIPPFGFTFSRPDDGGASDYENDPEAPSPLSCANDEVQEQGAMRCLRFSAGIENSGSGPLELWFKTKDPQRRMFQLIRSPDGSVRKRQAGRFEFHETHNHFHYEGIWGFSLLKVQDSASGRMEAVSKVRKGGFCPANQRIARWHSFVQAAQGAVRGDCGMRFVDTADGTEVAPRPRVGTMAFSPGWGDVYGWYRPGNFVDSRTELVGEYVVRAHVDAAKNVLESRESNNWAYAYIRVRGFDVELIERGLGKDPWDPRKRVIHDWFD